MKVQKGTQRNNVKQRNWTVIDRISKDCSMFRIRSEFDCWV